MQEKRSGVQTVDDPVKKATERASELCFSWYKEKAEKKVIHSFSETALWCHDVFEEERRKNIKKTLVDLQEYKNRKRDEELIKQLREQGF